MPDIKRRTHNAVDLTYSNRLAIEDLLGTGPLTAGRVVIEWHLDEGSTTDNPYASPTGHARERFKDPADFWAAVGLIVVGICGIVFFFLNGMRGRFVLCSGLALVTLGILKFGLSQRTSQTPPN